MENKKRITLFVLLINILLTVVNIYLLFNAFVQTNTNIWQTIEIVADLIACVVALFYLIEGYSKGLAKRYKLFLIVTAINAFAVTVLSLGEKTPILSMIMCSLAFIILLVLSLSKNLGKTKSYICCGLLFLIRFSGLISNIVMMNGKLPAINFALFLSQITLAILVFVSTYAKYTDKALRKNIN